MTKLVFPQQTMIQHVVGGNGGVQIRGNIQVKGNLNIFRLAHSIHRQRWIEETGQASVIDRETVIRYVQDRYFSDSEARMPCCSKTFVLIKSQFTGCDIPVIVARLAEGECGTLHFQHLIFRRAQLLSRPP